MLRRQPKFNQIYLWSKFIISSENITISKSYLCLQMNAWKQLCEVLLTETLNVTVPRRVGKYYIFWMILILQDSILNETINTCCIPAKCIKIIIFRWQNIENSVSKIKRSFLDYDARYINHSFTSILLNAWYWRNDELTVHFSDLMCLHFTSFWIWLPQFGLNKKR